MCDIIPIRHVFRTLATRTADLFVLFSNPFFFFKNETEAMEAIVFENSRSSSLPTAGDVSQGRTSLQLSDRNSILMT